MGIGFAPYELYNASFEILQSEVPMTLRYVSWLTVFVVAMAACSKKGTEGVHGDGRCTETTINSYNVIQAPIRRVLAPGTKEIKMIAADDPKLLKAAEAECAHFSNLVGADSCTASLESSKANVTISAESVRPACQKVHEKLHPEGKPSSTFPPSVPQPEPAQSPSKVVEADQKSLMHNLKGGTLLFNDIKVQPYKNFFLQDGVVLPGIKDVKVTKAYCQVGSSKAIPAKTRLKVRFFVPGPNSMLLASTSRALRIECTKHTQTPWTMSELKMIFKDLIWIQSL